MNNTKKDKMLSGALAFITLMGIVSLFSDMTHEGARSILGEYLNLTGASAATSQIIPKHMRSTGFGIFETGFGIAWFLGSWVLGILYDISPRYLVIVSAAAQLLAIVFYLLCIRQNKKEEVV